MISKFIFVLTYVHTFVLALSVQGKQGLDVDCIVPCHCSIFDAELSDAIPVVRASINGCRILGSLCVGNASTNDTHCTFKCDRTSVVVPYTLIIT